ncbi:MAG: adenylate/guanylate cyclase domain-containing protein [Planctomycetes bacterium]|nr:adenylate/guanylate cyclase domain-containing protein [Planctomycetota bacterium]
MPPARHISLAALIREWEARDAAAWAGSPDKYITLGIRAVELAEPTRAVDILREGLAALEAGGPAFGRSEARISMQYALALAWARCGSLREAEKLAREIVSRARIDAGRGITREGETAAMAADALALLGSVAKKRWGRVVRGSRFLVHGQPRTAKVRSAPVRASEEEDRLAAELRTQGDLAEKHYRQAWRASKGDPFPGVNLASMLAARGKATEARAVAERVLRAVNKRLAAMTEQEPEASATGPDHQREASATGGGARAGHSTGRSRAGHSTRRSRSGHSISRPAPDPWLLACAGEACVALSRVDEAVEWYEKSRAGMERAGDAGNFAAARIQLRLFAPLIPAAADVLARLRSPVVAAYTGHMIDAPGRGKERFPPWLEPAAARAVAQAVKRLDVAAAYGSAACGADILFLEALQRRGAETHVILPFPKADFTRVSVAFAGETWLTRFHAVLDKAASVTEATGEPYDGDHEVFAYANDFIAGAAALRAERLGVEAVALTLLDAEALARPGGARDAEQRWLAAGRRVERIALEVVRERAGTVHGSRFAVHGQPRTANYEPRTAHHKPRTVKAMLFADVVGYSRVAEGNAPAFFVTFLGLVSKVLKGGAAKPVFQNTWGDGLFMVFDHVTAAADVALRLLEEVRGVDWPALGLERETGVRVGLHAGPVFSATDPIVRRRNFFGSHVNRAARIEPVAAPGAAFVSEAFAATLAAGASRDFACDYIGVITLAKGFGAAPLYRLRRATEAE